MVRQLALEFLHRQTETGLSPESEEVTLAFSFALASSHGKGKGLKSLSQISIPFWVVQINETQSIMLSAAADTAYKLEFSENPELSSVSRILANETGDVRNIPDTIEKALPLFEKIEQHVQYIKSIIDPIHITRVGLRFAEVKLESKPNSMNLKIDSQNALQISQDFQELLNKAKSRIGKIEELQKLVKDLLDSKADALKAKVESEEVRWGQRARTLGEIEELEISELTEKKRDRLYDLEESQRIELRGLTAEFARSIAPLEKFFNNILGKVKEKTLEVSQKGEDIETAIRIFRELIDYLRNVVPNYVEPVEVILTKSREILEKAEKIDKTLQEKSREAAHVIDSQIRDHKHRIVEFSMERDQAEIDLLDLEAKVNSSVTQMKRAIGDRLNRLHEEYDKISRVALESSTIANLAPLTQLFIINYVAVYEDNSKVIFTPGILPKDRFSLPTGYQILDTELDSFIKGTIDILSETSPTFENEYHNRLMSDSALIKNDDFDKFQDGLGILQRKQLFEEGVREQLASQWEKIFGKCPQCGEKLGVDTKFCPHCGVSLK
jgi:hypothetical protein